MAKTKNKDKEKTKLERFLAGEKFRTVRANEYFFYDENAGDMGWIKTQAHNSLVAYISSMRLNYIVVITEGLRRDFQEMIRFEDMYFENESWPFSGDKKRTVIA